MTEGRNRGSRAARLESPFDVARLTAFAVRHPAIVAIVWAAVIVALAPRAPEAVRRLESGVRIEGSTAAAVEADLSNRYESPYVDRVFLVASGIPDPRTEEGRHVLERIVDDVEAAAEVSGTLSFLDSADTLFVGNDGTAIVVAGLKHGAGAPDAILRALRERTTRLGRAVRKQYPNVDLGWTGEIPLNYDVRKVGADEARAAEVRVAPLALALLVLAFGGVVAALLPFGVGILAIVLTMGTAALLPKSWHLSILFQNVASMIGLGLGVDYALLTLSRFRESADPRLSDRTSLEEAAARAARTLMLAAFPVMIGFAALWTFRVNELRSVGTAGILVTGWTLLLAVTLLPATVGVFGDRIERGRVFRRRATPGKRLERWGKWVVSHPAATLVLSAVPLLLLAGQALRLRTGTLAGDWLPAGPESVRALHRLERSGRGGVLQTIRVVLDYPEGVHVTDSEGWAALATLTDALRREPRVERVYSLSTIVGVPAEPERLAKVRGDIRRSLMADDQSSTMVEVVPAVRGARVAANAAAYRASLIRLRDDAEALSRELRSADAFRLTGLRGTSLRVGGLPIANAEYQDAVMGRFRSVVALVVGSTLVVLFLGFRSVLVGVKAVALNLLSVGAAFGALVLVFQDGHGASLVGLQGATGGVFPIVLVLVYCIVFGLSMDYEVILVARVRESRREGRSETDAIAEGLTRTGGVVTSAASIMIAVFGGFAVGTFLPVKMLGFTLAAAVLFDATLVRLAVGPALLSLAGRWNWWPGSFEPRPAKHRIVQKEIR